MDEGTIDCSGEPGCWLAFYKPRSWCAGKTGGKQWMKVSYGEECGGNRKIRLIPGTNIIQNWPDCLKVMDVKYARCRVQPDWPDGCLIIKIWIPLTRWPRLPSEYRADKPSLFYSSTNPWRRHLRRQRRWWLSPGRWYPGWHRVLPWKKPPGAKWLSRVRPWMTPVLHHPVTT